jgi:hypothetical protein
MSDKKLLDVYVYIDTQLGETHILEKCLELYLITQTQYQVNFIKKLDYIIKKDNDIIENGIKCMKHAYSALKLKGKHEAWCFYITYGHINTLGKDVNVTLVLLNKDLAKNESNYIINKNSIKILIDMDKTSKLQIVSVFKSCLSQVLTTDKIIKYK